jgi:hypothetical protein
MAPAKDVTKTRSPPGSRVKGLVNKRLKSDWSNVDHQISAVAQRKSLLALAPDAIHIGHPPAKGRCRGASI